VAQFSISHVQYLITGQIVMS